MSRSRERSDASPVTRRDTENDPPRSYTSNPMVGKCDNGERIPSYVAVVLESRYMRSTPIYGDIVGKCYEGAVVIVVRHEEVEYFSPQAQVLLPDGMLGWIRAAALRPLKL